MHGASDKVLICSYGLFCVENREKERERGITQQGAGGISPSQNRLCSLALSHGASESWLSPRVQLAAALNLTIKCSDRPAKTSHSQGKMVRLGATQNKRWAIDAPIQMLKVKQCITRQPDCA